MTATELGQQPVHPVSTFARNQGVSLRTLIFIHVSSGLAAKLVTQSHLHREHLIKEARALTSLMLEELARDK